MTQHVVIVDDDDLTLKLFTGIADDIPGVIVHPFRSSSEAIGWYRGKQVDCFVFDYNMPLPNGLQMIALVRALPEFAHTPIIIVTGAHEREVRYQALDAGANDFLQKPVDYREMTARLSTLLALQAAQQSLAMKVDELQQSLLDAEERSRQHADRLEVLWRIAHNPNLRDDELIQTMLQHGASAIRPGQAYRGVLGRIEGEYLRIESLADTAGYEARPGEAESRPGALVSLSETVAGKSLERGGGTVAVDDVQETEFVTGFVRARDWRSMIVTSFSAGGENYVLAFASRQRTAKPFGSQDTTYIGVLSSFFSAYFQQRWQSSRLGHQLEHDSLTGLWNRSRFRSIGRAAFVPGAPAAVAVVDLVHFHDINETFGHLTGDAVLVEVAAALTAKAVGDEIVARVGSDAFAIFFPSAASGDWLLDRVRAFGSVFDNAMGLGDRDGKETLRVSGRIGIARAPADGLTLDDLLLHAEGRARAAGAGGNQRIFPA